MKRFAVLFFLLLAVKAFSTPHLVSVGVGGFDIGSTRKTRALVQAEYKWNGYFWGYVRPQAGLLTVEFNSLYFYAGVGVEVYVHPHVVVIPSFCPGVYWRGQGKNLGHPIEFRSAIELAYEFCNCVRLGGQFYHISNASLGKHNSGANCFAFFIAIPFCCY